MSRHGAFAQVLLAIASAISVLLWFALSADLEDALVWAIKSFDPFGYSVRKDKVLICLSWSLFGLVAVVWTYKLAVLRVLLVVGVAALVLAVGVVEVSDTLVAAMIYLNALAAWLKAMAFIFILKSVAPMVAAYALLTREVSSQRFIGLASAVTVGACSLMICLGLFDLVYPGVSWR